MKNMPSFEVDREGLRQLQQGREPWRLAKEIVANSFDEESVSRIAVSLEKRGKALAVFNVTDDGDGFENISDAWTLYSYTSKRDNPNVRGRFNLGEKEIVCIAREARIETTSGWVAWDRQGKRSQGHKTHKRGTVVTLKLNWLQAECDEVIMKLKQLLPPIGKTYIVNGKNVPHRKPLESFTASLPTVLFNRRTGGLSPTVRFTKILTYKVSVGETPSLMEMGIPVQEISAPFHISVEQKIPLSPHRNAVAPAYLQDVYAETLNAMVSYLSEDEIAVTWVDKALTDGRCKDKTVKALMQVRYPKSVIWSPDSQANERAREKGLDVVHPRGIDHNVVERFRTVGMATSHEKFGSPVGDSDKPSRVLVPREEWTPEMRAFESFARVFGKRLLDFAPAVCMMRKVRWVKNDNSVAEFGNQTLTLFVNKLDLGFFGTIESRQVGLLIHEFAHHNGDSPDGPHGVNFKRNLDRLAGKAVMLALREPALFDYGRYKDAV